MFDPEIAAIRFGSGLSPKIAAPVASTDLLSEVRGRDVMAARFPVEDFETYAQRVLRFNQARRAERKARGTEDEEPAKAAKKMELKAARQVRGDYLRALILRRLHAESGFRERLTAFWADHFTARSRAAVAKWATTAYVEAAIRPHVAGRFEDMLIAAVTHPVMLDYLDQTRSVGPNSKVAARRGKGAGLNENLAREVLELHTLGVGGPYAQTDVRELAELFTGLTYSPKEGFRFRAAVAEPGAETVLGQTYSGRTPELADIHAVLRDLARHPATAAHLAHKLAVHFVSDTPPEDLVTALTEAYRVSDGDLMVVYAALLDHPASWQGARGNVKKPFDYMTSALRALGVGEAHFARLQDKHLLRGILQPLAVMGQSWQEPAGPDGWAEGDAHWIRPQFMAARLQWAMAAPQALMRSLPDPRRFAEEALGSAVSEDLRFAASAAENRWEGIALVLMSPAFQRQ